VTIRAGRAVVVSGAALFAACANVWGFGDLHRSDGGTASEADGASSGGSSSSGSSSGGSSGTGNSSGASSGSGGSSSGSGSGSSGSDPFPCAADAGCNVGSPTYCTSGGLKNSPPQLCCVGNGGPCGDLYAHLDQLGATIRDCTPPNTCTQQEAMCFCMQDGNLQGNCETTTCPGAVCGHDSMNIECNCWGYGGSSSGSGDQCVFSTAAGGPAPDGGPPCACPTNAGWM
jgi:hypothetical protein